MPEMTLLGWFHTVLGVLAVLSGFYTLYKYRVISYDVGPGKLYILVTLLVAGSALGIYCLLYTSPSPRDRQKSRMPSSA